LEPPGFELIAKGKKVGRETISWQECDEKRKDSQFVPHLTLPALEEKKSTEQVEGRIMLHKGTGVIAYEL